MTHVAYKLQAFVKIEEGMRLRYDCPTMSAEDHRSDEFFRKYRGRVARIVGFPTVEVGPLDFHGRTPGLYLSSKHVDVQFEGEEEIHRNLYIHHFVLIDVAPTVASEEYEASQRVGELPEPLAFYPGDLVRMVDDLLQGERYIEDVTLNLSGGPEYTLAETLEAAALRQERARSEKFPFGMMSFPVNERCRAADLVLIARGPIYFLYNEPDNLSFASAEEELAFWAQSGLSVIHYGSRFGHPFYEWSYDDARKLVEQGVGDLIVVSRLAKLQRKEEIRYVVHKLHACFEQHRERIRALSLATTTPMEAHTLAEQLDD